MKNSRMRALIVLIWLVLFTFAVKAQRALGTWLDYLAFTHASKVAEAGDKVFCVTEGGLFYYDLEDNSVNKFTVQDGLSDIGIKTIAYSTENEVLIVAYQNSNIDLIYRSQVVNLSDIKRKLITGDKGIYNISFYRDEAYLACGFGIVVVNLGKQEIKDTYYIGDDGSALKVNDVENTGEYLFAATDEGILKAPASGANLLDYNSWEKEGNIQHANSKFNHLVVHSGRLIANYAAGQWYADEMFYFDGNSWNPYLPEIKYAFDIQATNKYLLIASREDVFVIDQNHTVIGKINNYQFGDEQVSPIHARSSVVTGDGSIWIADDLDALVRLKNEKFERTFPGGPIDNSIFSVNHSNSDLWIAPGGTSGFEKPRFQRLRDGEWTYFNDKTHEELEGFPNIVSIEANPDDANHFFVSSWGGGLLEYRNDELVERYTNKNSPLETAVPDKPDEPYVRIWGMDFDSEGNLWVTNSEVRHNVHKLSPSGEWESFVLPQVANKYNASKLIVTSNDDKWVLIPSGHDAYVINKSGDQVKRLLVTSYFNNGENEVFTRMNDVYSIVEDLEGAIWMGTSKGVAVYNNPQRVWSDESFFASQPGLDLNDGIYHPLLETETVTAIAVDGANRKWMGTQKSGVYLIAENGEKEILHFTKENSPLLSNSITSIAIDNERGEVFFGTNEGLISYQGEAIGGKDEYSDVYVYPNPVRENYDGPVTITGLIENTDVKITDISGNLVYQTTSLGGQAIWDGKNLNGNRVRTGVYLVFCNDDQGEETHITKLLFIN